MSNQASKLDQAFAKFRIAAFLGVHWCFPLFLLIFWVHRAGCCLLGMSLVCVRASSAMPVGFQCFSLSLGSVVLCMSRFSSSGRSHLPPA